MVLLKKNMKKVKEIQMQSRWIGIGKMTGLEERNESEEQKFLSVFIRS